MIKTAVLLGLTLVLIYLGLELASTLTDIPRLEIFSWTGIILLAYLVERSLKYLLLLPFKAYFKDALSLTREAWKSLKCPIVVLGLGFVKNSFVDYVQDTDEELAAKIVDVKGVHSSGVSGINEAIRSGVLTKTLKNARMAEETKHVEEVLARLGAGKNDVTYGLDEVTKATQYGAVERLLITDKLLRESPDEKRLELERIMREAEKKGAQVTVVSTEHEAGHKLESLSGIAALLRFQVS